ncbi:hypothetical protein GCK72_020315 [Caenorhabditis remanei]|uniref:G-protein coupled receptors family 1 profile domain-containing protein n=1 Tax=Caenorhabditis remanei TaxID=31234 RepID=A0A6A5GEY6_CAERE|nr:hypothetical protein GCK72_020315 [Caenorhabditis remanei]KAF1753758.1 hypothetical protein GCK72_020315 [Caenorhabditis remanei]
MMTSSTNVLLIGIGVHDLSVMLSVLAPMVDRADINGCDLPPSELRVYIELFSYSITDLSRRCSLWLGVSLALVRPAKLGLIRFGWYIIIILTLISFLFTVPFHFRLTVVDFADWHPKPECGFPENFTVREYGYLQRPIYYENNELVLKLNFLLNAIFSKILPCILFIFLGFFLGKELKYVKESRKSIVEVNVSKKRPRTTKLVIYMTISYLLAEFPAGIIIILQYVLVETPGFLVLLSSLALLFNFLNTLNATVHCFICFTMSIHYRNTVKRILYCNSGDSPVQKELKA